MLETDTNSRRRGQWRVACGLAAALLIAAGHAAYALEPATALADYARQTWVMENGLPQNSVHALAQTRDGFLWIGTEAGLVRFDGVSFLVLDEHSQPKLPSGDIRCLLAASDGALWVGTGDGLAGVKDGAVTVESADDKRGCHTPEEGVEGFRAVLTSGVAATGTRTDVVLHEVKPLALTTGKELPGTRVQTILADREGCLWIGTNNGLARWAAGKVQRLPVTDALATASILSLLEDREGNLWVGTETDGLHILRDSRFRTIGMRDGLSSDATTTVVEDSAGTLWVGTGNDGLNALRRNASGEFSGKNFTVKDGLLSDVVLALAAGPKGDVWAGTPDGLSLIRGGRVESFTSGDGLADDFIRSLLVDADGSLWVGTRRGLTHWMDAPRGRMTTYTQANGLGSDLVGAMARDARGSLWAATLAGLSRIDANRIVNYTTAQGLSSSVVTALLPRADGTLLVGTQGHGWDLWDGAKFSGVKDTALRTTTVRAILEDSTHHLWFATANGIARCDWTGSADCSGWLEFGPADGLRSREMATNSHPSAWQSRDGRLWFATPRGLVEVDPAHFPVNTTPPPVVVERFAVDDSAVAGAADSSMRIAAGHNHFQFDYAGLSFVAPQKVRYRYMLDGFDHAWTEAGARRTAYYTNIPPGKYTFRVQAANNDGVWNLQGASLAFELDPHFYQTIWFYVLLTVCVAGLVVLVLKRRLLLAEREFDAVLGERNRIAREIHDTLAQGYVGISVQLEVLSELLRHGKVDAAATQLNTTRGHVREGLAEARQSIWALRSQDSGEKTLPVTLRRVTERAGGHGLETSFAIHGAYRALTPETEREILLVAQEALHNVKKHAAAQHAWVRLEYGPAELALEVRDDGRGFAAGNEASAPPGHFGLTGMRERASAIDGTLDVESELGAGTTVRLHLATAKETR